METALRATLRSVKNDIADEHVQRRDVCQQLYGDIGLIANRVTRLEAEGAERLHRLDRLETHFSKRSES